jgi:CheY-like chemotaxis protein
MALANQTYWAANSTFDEGGCGVYQAAGDKSYNQADVRAAFALVRVTTKDAAMERIPSGLFDLVMLDIEMAQGFSCGASDFIATPCNDLELLARLQAQLDVGKLNEAYTRFAPVEFLKHLQHESVLNVRLGDQTQAEMTVMYFDTIDLKQDSLKIYEQAMSLYFEKDFEEAAYLL